MAEVSGGGSIAVADPELFEHADRHAAFACGAELLAHRMRRIDGLVSPAAASTAALTAEYAIDDAIVALRDAAGRAQRLSGTLRSAATAYGAAESAAAATQHLMDGAWAYLFGRLALLGSPWLFAMGGAINGLAGVGAFDGIGRWLTEHPGVYTDSLMGDLSGAVVEGSDEFIAGVLGIPLTLVPLLGGRRFSAATTGTVGRWFGAFGETPVRIAERVSAPPPQPPTSLTDAVARIKSIEESGAQVLIERYELAGGGSVANVYIAGTIDWSIVATDQPFDMSANVNGFAGFDNAGYQAVRQSMVEAGLDDGTPVQLFGFSQGGLQATLVAASDEFNVATLVTVGSPGGHIPVNPSIRGIAVGHTEDPVHGTSPPQPGMVYWRDTRFGDERPSIEDGLMPAHQFAPYLDTIAELQESGARIVADERDRILAMTDGAVSATSTAYRAERYTPDECVPER